jgi:hypothetical protein
VKTVKFVLKYVGKRIGSGAGAAAQNSAGSATLHDNKSIMIVMYDYYVIIRYGIVNKVTVS